MNLLFTSAGRRGYILDYFRTALGGRGEIHAANSSPNAPAFAHADETVVTPLIYSDDYISFLLSYCVHHEIRAIVPLFDLDLPVLAGHKAHFSDIGVTVVASSETVAAFCNDKWATLEHLRAHGFDAPRTHIALDSARKALKQGALSFPVVIKPRWGMGSIGLYLADDEQELLAFYGKTVRDIERTYLKYETAADPTRAVLIQEHIDTAEYGLDVVNNLDGKYEATFVKQKLSMRAGETDSAVTVDDPALAALGRRLGVCVGHVGNLDADVFETSDKTYVLELNARFGGGYPFSHVAGADVPGAIVAWLDGLPTPEGALKVRPGVRAVKDTCIAII